MPIPVGNLWSLQWSVDGDTEATEPVNIDTDGGDAQIHASFEEALRSGTTSIAVTKSA